MKIFVPIPFFSLLVSYDMGIWNKKTTIIKINNNEKGFIQVKETIQASINNEILKKIRFSFGLVKVDSVWWIILVNQTECSLKKNNNFAFTAIWQQYTFDISIKILVKKITNINFILHFASRYQNGHLIKYWLLYYTLHVGIHILIFFLAHLAKGNVGFWRHLASVICCLFTF
jgi:hypothetical protein